MLCFLLCRCLSVVMVCVSCVVVGVMRLSCGIDVYVSVVLVVV